jgi:hypothetical protein
MRSMPCYLENPAVSPMIPPLENPADRSITCGVLTDLENPAVRLSLLFAALEEPAENAFLLLNPDNPADRSIM